MDAILLAQHLPLLAEVAMRQAIVAAIRVQIRSGRRSTQRDLCTAALIIFERSIERVAHGKGRSALIFAHRQAIAGALRNFTRGRLAWRLQKLAPGDILQLGRDAKPFDLTVRGRHGGIYGVAFGCLPRDGRRLERLWQLRRNAAGSHAGALRGVVFCDLTSGSVRTLRTAAAAALSAA